MDTPGKIKAAAGMVFVLITAGWGAAHTLATKADVKKTDDAILVVKTQSEYALDILIEHKQAKIERLKLKKKKKPEDLKEVEYLREDIERIRKLKRLK